MLVESGYSNELAGKFVRNADAMVTEKVVMNQYSNTSFDTFAGNRESVR